MRLNGQCKVQYENTVQKTMDHIKEQGKMRESSENKSAKQGSFRQAKEALLIFCMMVLTCIMSGFFCADTYAETKTTIKGVTIEVTGHNSHLAHKTVPPMEAVITDATLSGGDLTYEEKDNLKLAGYQGVISVKACYFYDLEDPDKKPVAPGTVMVVGKRYHIRLQLALDDAQHFEFAAPEDFKVWFYDPSITSFDTGQLKNDDGIYMDLCSKYCDLAGDEMIEQVNILYEADKIPDCLSSGKKENTFISVPEGQHYSLVGDLRWYFYDPDTGVWERCSSDTDELCAGTKYKVDFTIQGSIGGIVGGVEQPSYVFYEPTFLVNGKESDRIEITFFSKNQIGISLILDETPKAPSRIRVYKDPAATAEIAYSCVDLKEYSFGGVTAQPQSVPGLSYRESDQTLMMNGYNGSTIYVDPSSEIRLGYMDVLTVSVEGNNTIKPQRPAGLGAIFCRGRLTLKGSGKLTIDCSDLAQETGCPPILYAAQIVLDGPEIEFVNCGPIELINADCTSILQCEANSYKGLVSFRSGSMTAQAQEVALSKDMNGYYLPVCAQSPDGDVELYGGSVKVCAQNKEALSAYPHAFFNAKDYLIFDQAGVSILRGDNVDTQAPLYSGEQKLAAYRDHVLYELDTQKMTAWLYDCTDADASLTSLPETISVPQVSAQPFTVRSAVVNFLSAPLYTPSAQVGSRIAKTVDIKNFREKGEIDKDQQLSNLVYYEFRNYDSAFDDKYDFSVATDTETKQRTFSLLPTSDTEGIRVVKLSQDTKDLYTNVAEYYDSVLFIFGEKSTHVHEWSRQWTYDAAHHWHECSAAYCTIKKDANKSGYSMHTFGDWMVLTPATAQSEGLKERTCICGYKQTAKIEKLQEEGTAGNGGTGTVDGNAKDLNETVKKGDVITDKKAGVIVKVISVKAKSGNVTIIGTSRKSATSLTVPDTVKLGGKSFQVTQIAANAFRKNKKLKSIVIGKNVKKIGAGAFYGCTNLKKIKVKTTYLKKKSVGKNAFGKIHAKAKFSVPKKRLSSYKKILKKAGAKGKKQKFVRIK